MLADNGQRIEYIRTQAALEDSCRNWLSLPVIAIDTEFMRSNTFYPKLGLLQVADGSQCYLIDPLKISDWSCFISVLSNPGCEIVLHSGGEDLLTLLIVFGQLPGMFFDTQMASAYAGLGFSLSYHALVRKLVGRELPKDQTRSDWLQRPLSESQLTYAANDVCYLLPIYRELSSRLDARGYLGFLRGDAKAQLDSTELNEQSDNWALSYTTISNSWRLSDLSLACLQRLCVWREEQARKRNLPRSWVAKDTELFAVSQLVRDHRKLTVGDLNDCAAPGSALVRRHGDKLVRLVNSPPDFSLIDRSLLSPHCQLHCGA